MHIKKVFVRTFYRPKKDLQIEESPLLKGLKYLHSRYGTHEKFDVRTYKEYLQEIELKTLWNFVKSS